MTHAHYPPQPEIRPATLDDVRSGVAVTAQAAVREHPFAWPVGSPDSSTLVTVAARVYPDHPYRESMIYPAGAVRALCMVCRGTHTDSEVRA